MSGAQKALMGAMLAAFYTVLISCADAITKLIAGGYAAPQLYAISGFLVVMMCLGANRFSGTRVRGLLTVCPRAMALRSVATVLAALSFFYAFKLLPFADVFIFIGLMPVMAGLMSGLILGEKVRPGAWIALMACFTGVLCLFPEGIRAMQWGHAFAFAATCFGTFSIVLARYIGRWESNALAQVFYPNLAIFVSMAVVLPLVWKPMPIADLGWVAAYAAILFGARWLLVVALRLLAAYAVTPMMNLQFVWMVLLGAVFFGEVPGAETYLGVAIVIGSGLFLIWDQFVPATVDIKAQPAVSPRR
ncbi:MAG: DMT family transporter [Heliomarina sp.]|uniref:DMT family transporter n=1 Tax=Heliomarina sp. TaxID=2917556 RepID=UPI004059113F